MNEFIVQGNGKIKVEGFTLIDRTMYIRFSSSGKSLIVSPFNRMSEKIIKLNSDRTLKNSEDEKWLKKFQIINRHFTYVEITGSYVLENVR